jgi:hypothetical protein
LQLILQSSEDLYAVGLPLEGDFSVSNSFEQSGEKLVPSDLVSEAIDDHVDLCVVVGGQYVGRHEVEKSQRNSEEQRRALDHEEVPHGELGVEWQVVHKQTDEPLSHQQRAVELQQVQVRAKLGQLLAHQFLKYPQVHQNA